MPRRQNAETFNRASTVEYVFGHFTQATMFSFFKKKPKPQKLHEFSTNFDADLVRPFLERVQRLIESGFGAGEVEQVCQVVATLPHDQERTLEFQVQHAGSVTPFRIQVFMDDIAAPDIYFFTSAMLARQIDVEFDRFTTERAM
jgi:hypothetical protein